MFEYRLNKYLLVFRKKNVIVSPVIARRMVKKFLQKNHLFNSLIYNIFVIYRKNASNLI